MSNHVSGSSYTNMTTEVKIPFLPELYSKYKEWISKNPEGATTMESTLKWVSWYLTGRLSSSNANLLAELVFTLSKLLVLFNDHVIYNSLVLNNDASSNKNHKFKVWLTVLEYSEVFIELAIYKLYGDFGKWIAILAIQIVKTVARISLLYSKDKLLIEPLPIPVLDRDNLSSVHECSNGSSSRSSPSGIVLPSGRVVRSVKNSPNVSQRDWKPLDKIIPMKETTQQKLFYTELLYILKPLIHLGSSYKYGLNTWRPYLTSLAIDVTCTSVLYQERTFLHKPDKVESTRRMIQLLLYLLRSPFYERHSRLRLERLLLSLCDYRLLKLVCNPLREYIPYWQSTYFYLWSS
uniref:Peroxisomal membrane protein PEX16 n=1 Tax=Cacopsylla melanoneura TaxID=428564 RepID=A0A8D9ERJ2_9HEMI